MRLIPAVLVAVQLAAAPVAAASPDEVDELIDLLGLPRILEIMAVEGEDYGAELQQELLGGEASGKWSAMLDTIYAPEAMMQVFRPGFTELMAEVDAAPLLEFFGSDPGQRIITLEVEAREAMLDEDIEAAAGERLAMMRDGGDPRLDLLGEYVEVNALVDNNVVGALNSSYAFYTALAAGGVFDDSMTEDQILSDVWGQEEAIRLDTIEWVFGYLTMAYGPLKDDEIRAYIDLSRTESGQGMNRALFDAFNRMYVTISQGLGHGLAQLMSGQDI